MKTLTIRQQVNRINKYMQKATPSEVKQGLNMKTINGMIIDSRDTIATHLLKANLGFYELYRELRSNMGYSHSVNGIETICLTDNSEVVVNINTNEIQEAY